MNNKKKHPQVKSNLHPKNKHRQRYDFNKLIGSCPELEPFVGKNKYGDASIDFFNPDAVRTLNKALLMHYYDIAFWEIPEGYLCPPVPGRADYIHHVAELLGRSANGKIPTGKNVRCLDIGTGANCIYPIIGSKAYGWSFVGTDTDPVSIEAAAKIVEQNPRLKGRVELRLQKNANAVFENIFQEDEYFDLTICNPPFHSSPEAVKAASRRKISNLTKGKNKKASLNFGGKNRELWCEGGEEKFVQTMVKESKKFAQACLWFSTLISKESNLIKMEAALEKEKALAMKVLPMGQGQKKSRIVAWTFLSRQQEEKWVKLRWRV